MSVMEDLISFDVIEEQKENIQSLPQGRSAKALAAQFGSPTPFSPLPTPGATRTLNDAIRQEYETELQSIGDSDDPLDIYDRYVKWTFNAYPSAQATSESQLRPLLERATKTFQGSAQYKNDVRYLKLWLNYIRFFSDAPRETYAYLSRHGIGDGLALFYEEFAAWLEGAGRWTQADEVYRLGIDKEARPSERLLRKFTEFQKRFEARPQDANEPTSPALPTVRPALAAKLDPFASSASPSDPQASRGVGSGGKAKSGRAKMAIFSDADGSTPSSRPGSNDQSKGWDNIGTIAERKKENVMEARPWVGETLKGGKKSAGPKMMVFKDQSSRNVSDKTIILGTKNGRTEIMFADLYSVCPNENDTTDEYCFEELRAKSRGWLDRKWSPLPKAQSHKPKQSKSNDKSTSLSDSTIDNVVESTQTLSLGDNDTTLADVALGMGGKKSKSKKKRVMEVKGETQTIKAVLDSPTSKTKLKRKKSSEPTMTLHTRAATDDVLDIFNQPLRNVGPIGSHAESDGDTTDYDPDDYTCGLSSNGDNTTTGIVSETGSEYNDDPAEYQTETVADSTQPESASPWSDFNTGKHVPEVDDEQTKTGDLTGQRQMEVSAPVTAPADSSEELKTPVEQTDPEDPHTRYLPTAPEGVEVPTMPFRTAEQAAQSRLPFMTPIVEKTESSSGIPTVRVGRDYFASKTPSRRAGDITEPIPELLDDVLEESVPQAGFASDKAATTATLHLASEASGPAADKAPIIHDAQLNPHDEPIRNAILEAANLKSLSLYHDERPAEFKKGAEIRKYNKSLQKNGKPLQDKTTVFPPSLQFPAEADVVYTVRRELGKGAYAAPFLVAAASVDSPDETTALVAVKSESPPSPWEFYILSTLHSRLTLNSSRLLASITKPYALHHFSDEVYLLESYHDQGTLLDLVNLVRAEPSLVGTANSSSPPPGLDECVAMFFAVELLRTLDGMHSARILHGDLKADNCLLRLGTGTAAAGANDGAWSARYDPAGGSGWADKGLALIDFGRGVDLAAFRPDVGFLADWKTSRDDCVEMRELRPWTHQVDYWGAAGVLHVLLFGKWIEDVVEGGGGGGSSSRDRSADEDAAEKTMVVGKAGVKRRRLKDGLKRYWQTELWGNVFDVLMNPMTWVAEEANGMPPVKNRLLEVRTGLEQWLVENSEKKGLKTQLKRLEDRIREKRRKE